MSDFNGFLTRGRIREADSGNSQQGQLSQYKRGNIFIKQNVSTTHFSI